MDPFSVDFDPRWAKRLDEESLARQRYLDHVISQVLDVLQREPISVLFITPPALAELTRRLSDRQREQIRGIHYGGMSMTPETINGFRAAYPQAVHLAGYGNTLFGVAMEVEDGPRQALDYFPQDGRLRLHVIDWPNDESPSWPPRLLPCGRTGRVLFHRLDESTLLVGVVERDEAEAVSPSPAARNLGASQGVRNPRCAEVMRGKVQLGLY